MTTASNKITLEEYTCWQADKRLLPPHLRSSDNTRRVMHYRIALNNAMKTQLSEKEREQLLLFYEKSMTKTQIGKAYGIGSSAVCKTLKSAEEKIRRYVELYMQIYSLLENEKFDHDDESDEICRGEAIYARHAIHG